MVCRFADPPLFWRLVSPVTQVIDRASIAIKSIIPPPRPAAPSESDAASSLPQAQGGEPDMATTEILSVSEQQVADEPESRGALSPDFTITSLEPRGDSEILTGGTWEIVYYNQSDPLWADLPYGSDNIGRYGCGPTAMAMVVSSMTELSIAPAEMAVWAKSQGYWASGSGSYLSIVEGTATAYGLQCTSLTNPTPEQLVQALAGGQIAVALMGRGHFTNNGHFILFRGATLSGEILVADPNSRERSLSLWDAELLIDELSSSRHNGAPLWLISPSIDNGNTAP